MSHKTLAREWSLLRDWIPLFISLFALAVALWQAWEQHADFGLQVRPVVDFYTSSDTKESKVGVQLQNSGPGVALIKSITYYVNHRAVGNYDAAATASKTDAALIDYYDFDRDDSLAVNEQHWIFFRDTSQKKDLERFSDFVDKNLGVEVQYCSVNQQCWTKCSVKGMCATSNAH